MTDTSTFNKNDLRSAFGQFATGVCLVSCYHNSVPLAITVNSFSSVSLNPPLILWSIQNHISISGVFLTTKRFSLCILGDSQIDLAENHANEATNQLSESNMREGNFEVPLIKDALAAFVCIMDRTVPCGDHTILIGKVIHISINKEGDPLLFHKGSYASLDSSSI